MIKIKTAHWSDYVSSCVLEQNGTYLNPYDDMFMGSIFKEYVNHFFKKESIILELSKEDIFFYSENSNAYLFNYIYNNLFPNKDKNPFACIDKYEDENVSETINDGLFDPFSEQLDLLVNILEKMNIKFDKLIEDYHLSSFPSFKDRSEEEISYLRYEDY